MNKKIYAALFTAGALLFWGGNKANAQIQDEQNVTVTMDLEPVLQLNMNTPDQVDFVFDNIPSYAGGEIKYGATILTVSSTVNWSLYAVGYSTAASAGNLIWDNPVDYGLLTNGNATNKISLGALELHQTGANPPTAVWYTGTCATDDYSQAFAPILNNAFTGTAGQNNLYFSATPYTYPGTTHKYIAGGTPTVAGAGEVGGSYLLQATFPSNFYYAIDYRIVPGLPVIFPATTVEDDCATADPNVIVAPKFAQPGFYTMDVKYVLIESD